MGDYLNGGNGVDSAGVDVRYLSHGVTLDFSPVLSSGSGTPGYGIMLVDIERVHVDGTSYDDYLDARSSTYSQSLRGNGGSDLLLTGDGDDWLNGGAGVDEVRGGRGDDIYYVDGTSDVVIELDEWGGDIVNSSATFSLIGQYIEVLNLTGEAAINGTGNSLANRIVGNYAANILYGNDGNDRLDGGAGADTMRGDLGNDVFVVDNAGDVVLENNGGGTDVVEAWISYSGRRARGRGVRTWNRRNRCGRPHPL